MSSPKTRSNHHSENPSPSSRSPKTPRRASRPKSGHHSGGESSPEPRHHAVRAESDPLVPHKKGGHRSSDPSPRRKSHHNHIDHSHPHDPIEVKIHDSSELRVHRHHDHHHDHHEKKHHDEHRHLDTNERPMKKSGSSSKVNQENMKKSGSSTKVNQENMKKSDSDKDHRGRLTDKSPNRLSPQKERSKSREARTPPREKEEAPREKHKESDHKDKDIKAHKISRRVQVDPDALAHVATVHMMFAKRKIGLQDFERIRLLGKGGVGHVYLVRLKNTEQFYAMKVMKKQDMIERNKVKRVLTERDVLATANHPFISTLYYSFANSSKLFFIMQFCAGGEFYRWLSRQPGHCIPEEWAKFYAIEVLLALEYLHSLGFIYRDLKPENLLMQASGHIVLTDFDLSKHAIKPVSPRVITKIYSGTSGVVSEPELTTNSFVGTEEYLAPEVISGTGHGASVDWWAFGIFLYEMIFASTPFRGRTRDDTFHNIQKGELHFPEKSKHPLSRSCKKLLKALLHHNPKKRLGAGGGATDIKDHPFFKDVKWQLVKDQTPPYIPHLSGPADCSCFSSSLVDDWTWDDEGHDCGQLDEDSVFQGFDHENKRHSRDDKSKSHLNKS